MHLLRKIGVFALFGWAACFSSVWAQQSDARQNQIMELNSELTEQQKETKELRKVIDRQQQQIDRLQNNVARVYKQAIEDAGLIEKYRLSSEAYLRSTYYDLKRDEFDARGIEDHENAFVNYLDLKFSAQPTDEVQFNATLTMYKLWGAWNDPEDVGSADFNYSAKPSDSAVRIKRAYVDYRPEWLGRAVNLTFGRLPTSGGDLTRYRYNRVSQTTYPDLSFNAESDGVALTFYLDPLPVADSINLVYARSEDDTDANPFQSDPRGLEDIDFYAVQLNSKLAVFGDADLALQWFRVDNIRPSGDDAIRALFAVNNLSVPVFPDELGYMDKYTIQFNAPLIFDSPVDLFVSLGWSRSEPNGERVLLNGAPLDPAALPAAIAPAARYLYLLSADNQESESGSAVYAGFRWNIESERFRYPMVGVEYFEGSEYWVGLNIAALDPFQKLNTRGSVWEFYWIQPLVPNILQARAGYEWIDRKYTESLMSGLYGEPRKSDEEDRMFYVSLDYSF